VTDFVHFASAPVAVSNRRVDLYQSDMIGEIYNPQAAKVSAAVHP
jgi:hypothetical protein